MEKDSPWPQNQRKESKMNSVERIQELKKSLQEQNDLSETLSSSCKYFLSYYSLKTLFFCARLV